MPRPRPSPDTWGPQTTLACCKKRECPGYNPNILQSRPNRMAIVAIVQQQLYCRKCHNVFCKACKGGHFPDVCSSTAQGDIKEDDLAAAVERNTPATVQSEAQTPNKASVDAKALQQSPAAPQQSPAAAAVQKACPAAAKASPAAPMQSRMAHQQSLAAVEAHAAPQQAQAAAKPSTDAAAVQEAHPAAKQPPDSNTADPTALTAADSQRASEAADGRRVSDAAASQKRTRPSVWTSNSLLTCCLKKQCSGYNPEHKRPSPKRIKIGDVLRQGLYCSRCCNIFCSVCMQQHGAKQCDAVERGTVSKEDLLAAALRHPATVEDSALQPSTAPQDSTAAETAAQQQANSQQQQPGTSSAATVSKSAGTLQTAADSLQPPTFWAKRWTGNSALPCARKKQCCGFDPDADWPYQNRTTIVAILRQGLHCSKCCNVFCSGCMEQHTEEACEAMERGNTTREHLVAAVDRGQGAGRASSTAAAEPAAAEAASTEPAATEPVAAEATSAEPAVAEPAAAKPSDDLEASEHVAPATAVPQAACTRPRETIRLYDVDASNQQGKKVLVTVPFTAEHGPTKLRAFWPVATVQQQQQRKRRRSATPSATAPAAATAGAAADATESPGTAGGEQQQRKRGRARQNSAGSRPLPQQQMHIKSQQQQQQQQQQQEQGKWGQPQEGSAGSGLLSLSQQQLDVESQHQQQQQQQQHSSDDGDDEDDVRLIRRRLPADSSAGDATQQQQQQQDEEEEIHVVQPRTRSRSSKNRISQRSAGQPQQHQPQHRKQQQDPSMPRRRGGPLKKRISQALTAQQQQQQQRQNDGSSDDVDDDVPLLYRMASLQKDSRRQQQQQLLHRQSSTASAGVNLLGLLPAGITHNKQQQQQQSNSMQAPENPFAAAAGQHNAAAAAAAGGGGGAQASTEGDQQQLQRQGSSLPIASGRAAATAEGAPLRYPVVDHLELAGCVSAMPPLQNGEVRALGQTMHPTLADRYRQITEDFWRYYEHLAATAQTAPTRRAGANPDFWASLIAEHVSLDPPWVEPGSSESFSTWLTDNKIDPGFVRQQVVDAINDAMSQEFGVGCCLATERRLPENLPTRYMEVYTVQQDHPLEMLHGQKSVKAMEDVAPATVVGPYTGYMLLDKSYKELCFSKPATFSSGDRYRDVNLWELAVEGYAVQDHNYQVPQLSSPPRPRGRPPKNPTPAQRRQTAGLPAISPWKEVYCSAFGYGNATAAVNDPTRYPFPDEEWDDKTYPARDVVADANVMVRVVWVRNWPYLFMITCKHIKKGQDMWYDYSSAYWSILRDVVLRIKATTDLKTEKQIFDSVYELCRGNGAAVAALVEQITGRPQQQPQSSMPNSMLTAERLAAAANLPAELSAAPARAASAAAAAAAGAKYLHGLGSGEVAHEVAAAELQQQSVPPDHPMSPQHQQQHCVEQGRLDGLSPSAAAGEPYDFCSSSPEADDKALSAPSPLPKVSQPAAASLQDALVERPSSLEAAWRNVKANSGVAAAAAAAAPALADPSRSRRSEGPLPLGDQATGDSSSPPPPPPPPPPAAVPAAAAAVCGVGATQPVGHQRMVPAVSSVMRRLLQSQQQAPPAMPQQQQQQPAPPLLQQQQPPPPPPPALKLRQQLSRPADTSRPQDSQGGPSGGSKPAASGLRRGNAAPSAYKRSRSRSPSARQPVRSVSPAQPLRRGGAEANRGQTVSSERSRHRSRSRDKSRRRSRSRDRQAGSSGKRDRSRSRQRTRGSNSGRDRYISGSGRRRSGSRDRQRASSGDRYRSTGSRRYRSRSRDRHRSRSEGRHRSRSRERHWSSREENLQSCSGARSKSRDRYAVRDSKQRRSRSRGGRKSRSKSRDRRSPAVVAKTVMAKPGAKEGPQLSNSVSKQQTSTVSKETTPPPAQQQQRVAASAGGSRLTASPPAGPVSAHHKQEQPKAPQQPQQGLAAAGQPAMGTTSAALKTLAPAPLSAPATAAGANAPQQMGPPVGRSKIAHPRPPGRAAAALPKPAAAAASAAAAGVDSVNLVTDSPSSPRSPSSNSRMSISSDDQAGDHGPGTAAAAAGFSVPAAAAAESHQSAGQTGAVMPAEQPAPPIPSAAAATAAPRVVPLAMLGPSSVFRRLQQQQQQQQQQRQQQKAQASSTAHVADPLPPPHTVTAAAKVTGVSGRHSLRQQLPAAAMAPLADGGGDAYDPFTADEDIRKPAAAPAAPAFDLQKPPLSRLQRSCGSAVTAAAAAAEDISVPPGVSWRNLATTWPAFGEILGPAAAAAADAAYTSSTVIAAQAPYGVQHVSLREAAAPPADCGVDSQQVPQQKQQQQKHMLVVGQPGEQKQQQNQAPRKQQPQPGRQTDTIAVPQAGQLAPTARTHAPNNAGASSSTVEAAAAAPVTPGGTAQKGQPHQRRYAATAAAATHTVPAAHSQAGKPQQPAAQRAGSAAPWSAGQPASGAALSHASTSSSTTHVATTWCADLGSTLPPPQQQQRAPANQVHRKPSIPGLAPRAQPQHQVAQGAPRATNTSGSLTAAATRRFVIPGIGLASPATSGEGQTQRTAAVTTAQSQQVSAAVQAHAATAGVGANPGADSSSSRANIPGLGPSLTAAAAPLAQHPTASTAAAATPGPPAAAATAQRSLVGNVLIFSSDEDEDDSDE